VDPAGPIVVSAKQTYTVGVNAIGETLEFSYIPVRSENDVGRRLRAFLGTQERPTPRKLFPDQQRKVGKASWTAVAAEKGLTLKGPGGE
jgi:hypothetical protein